MPGFARQVMRTLVLPFLYFVSIIPVMVGVVVILSLVEFGTLKHYDILYRNLELIGLVALFLIGGSIFGIFSLAYHWLEGAQRYTFFDHLRRCSYLYVFVIILGAILIPNLLNGVTTGYSDMAGGIILWLVAGYAILVNALVLLWYRRRFTFARSGGTI